MDDDATPRASLSEQLTHLRQMFAFVRPYRWRLVVGTAAVVVAAGLGLVFPAVMGSLVDSALGSDAAENTERLNLFAVGLLVVFAVQAVFNYIRSFNLSVVGEGVVTDIRKALFDRIVRLPVPFFDGKRTGDITSRLTSDAAVVQSVVSDAVGRALSQAITLVLRTYGPGMIDSLSPSGVINGLYYLSATEPEAWDRQNIEAARQVVSRLEARAPGPQTRAALDTFKSFLQKL